MNEFVGVPQLILASGSSGRLKVLKEAGFSPRVVISDVDEEAAATQACATTGKEIAEVLSEAKAQRVAKLIAKDEEYAQTGAIVIGCDTVFEFDGFVYGKPRDEDDAFKQLKSFQGSSGMLYSGLTLVEVAPQTKDREPSCSLSATSAHLLEQTFRIEKKVNSTKVEFAKMSDAQILTYIKTGEPMNAAGCFNIDGLGASFIKRIDGDYLAVVGISIHDLAELLGLLGHEVTTFWGKFHEVS